MATKTASKARAKHAPRSTARGSKGRRAPAHRRAHARQPAWRNRFAAVFGRGEPWGLLLVVLGVIGALGIYGDAAGVFGRLVAVGLGGAIGLLRYVAPPILVAAGVLALRSAPRGGGDDRDTPARSTLPCAGLILAAAGALQVLRGETTLREAFDHLDRSGGVLGLLVGQPLEAFASRVGALTLLGLAMVACLFLSTGVSPMRLFGGIRRGAPAVSRPVLRRLNTLFQTPDATPPPTLALYDQDAPGGRRRRRRARDGEASAGPDVTVSSEAGAAGPDAGPRPEVRVGDLFAAAPEPAAPEPEPEPEALPEHLPAASSAQPGWKLPPITLLSRSGSQEVDRGAVERAGRTLEHALAEHGVETRLVGMVVGPTVTRYELELGPGVKVARVTSLHRDIAYAMATPDVRILAPIPGRQAIGVEVPNVHRQLVTVGDILVSEEARRADHPLEVAIGRDIAGRSVLANLAKMPHVLIAGATGAGKSSCINSLITSVLVRSTPEQVRMILIDPKRVELGQYNRLPHLLTQVVTNPKKAANALNWAVREMERRYDLLSEVGVRDITGYNAAYDRGDLNGERSSVLAKAFGPDADVTFPRLPYIIVVVDELNDLMMVAARDVEDAICRIAQMARAVGIHLVLATQRPSVNVITGVIKANIPARLAFAVSSLADSRVILDQAGAERLVGRGDMLILDGSSTAQRVQGAWVTEEEVRAVAAHWRRQAPDVAYVSGVEGSDDEPEGGGLFGGGASGDDDDDELFLQARELVVRSQFGSTSMLQRKLRVGFARAGRLMDLLEAAGVVGPSTGSKARDVLMTPEELDEVAGAR